MFIEQKLNYLIDTVNELVRKVDAMQQGNVEKPIDMIEASELTGYSLYTIRKYKDEIGYTQRGRKILFTTKDLEEWRHKFTNSPRK